MTRTALNAEPGAGGGPAGRTRATLRSALALGVLAAAACTDDVPVTAPEASTAAGETGIVTLRTAAGPNPRLVSMPRGAVVSARRAGRASGNVVPMDHVPGQAIVRFEPGSDGLARARQIVRAAGGTLRHSLMLDRAWVVEVPEGSEERVAAALRGMDGVEFAEPDFLMTIVPCESGQCDTPDDGFFGYKWDLHNDGSINNAGGAVLGLTGQTDADLDWLEMYQSLGPSFGGTATIGIIDSGIRDSHQDLVGRVVAARNFALGYPETLTEDRDGHGTHVAGIAGARGNNGIGVSGVAYGPAIQLISAKSCELYLFPDGSVQTSCPTSSTADAIVWAVDNGADVLNLSLGGNPAAAGGSALQQAALQYARANDVLPFCATGNDDYPGIAFPARFPECVAVGATNWSDARASYSNYGPEIELTAPGGDLNPLGTPYGFILSLDAAPGTATVNSYLWMAGTSMATPQVAGLAAMLRATGMGSADAILARLRSTTDDLGPAGWDPEFGFGRVNAFQAVTGRTLASMDVQPGKVSLARSAQVAVYLYSRPGFDATAVEPASVRLHPGGGGSGAAVMKRGSAYMTSVRDVNGDGRADRLLSFAVSDLKAAGLAVGTTSFVLRGATVEASDATPPVVTP